MATLCNLGSFLCDTQHDYKAAEEMFRKVLTLDEANTHALVNLAVVLMQQDQTVEAEAMYVLQPSQC